MGFLIKVENFKIIGLLEFLYDFWLEKYRGRIGYNKFNDYVRNVMINYLVIILFNFVFCYMFFKVNI